MCIEQRLAFASAKARRLGCLSKSRLPKRVKHVGFTPFDVSPLLPQHQRNRGQSVASHLRQSWTCPTVRARFALPRIALLYQRPYDVRQVEKQRSAEKAKHAAQRQIKALTGACNLIVAINVLRGLNKAPAGYHNNSDTHVSTALALSHCRKAESPPVR